MPSRYLPFIAAFFVIPALLVLFTGWAPGKPENSTEKAHIVMRKIGHAILLAAGDSTSRILPVQDDGNGKYLLQFEGQFAFVPDSLAQIIHRVTSLHQLPQEYRVNVLDCNRTNIVYGFTVSANPADDVASCVGRNQPKACYAIRISFLKPVTGPKYNIILVSLAGIAGIGLLFGAALWLRKKEPEPAEKELPGVEIPAPEPESIPAAKQFLIGSYIFHPNEQRLTWNDERIDLTSKESAILGIFAGGLNQVIDRARLQKEIWEDEGVIVGRSLDVFVSKLRKKLEKDPSIRIVNIHGKGYKLEISEQTGE